MSVTETLSQPTDWIAVVPVFVNTGAALLPALVAGLASFVTILFKPRLLVRTCIEKPYWPIGIAAAAVAAWLGIAYLGGGEVEAARAAHNSPAAVETGRLMRAEDWVRLARELAAGSNPAAAAPATTTHTAPAGASDARALYLAGGSSRSGWLGGAAPRKLSKLWEFSEPGAMFLSTPAVRGGRVYGAYCVLDPPGSYGSVVCLDAATGRKLWSADFKDGKQDFKGFFSSPAVTADGKSLVIGQGLHPDYDSELACLDAATGSVRWLIPTPLHVESSPAIEGDIVVAGVGAVEDAEHKPKAHPDPAKDKNPGYVLAAEISTGKVLWKHEVNDPESSPAIADGVVYIGSGFNGNAVVALRLRETDEQLKAAGLTREIWRTPTPYPATGAITLAGNVVLVGCGNGDYVFQAPEPAGAVLAIDKATGEIRWTLDMPDGVLGPIAATGRVAIVPVRSGEVVAIELPEPGGAGRPEVLWRQMPRKGGRVLAGCALTESRVYVVTHDGFLTVLDAETGEVIEAVYANADPGEQGMSIATPLVAGGRVFVGTETGGLRCYGHGGN